MPEVSFRISWSFVVGLSFGVVCHISGEVNESMDGLRQGRNGGKGGQQDRKNATK